MEVWSNPRCSKCRTAVAALDEAGADYTVRRYLDQPPTSAELHGVLARLGLEPWEITRLGEPIARELRLADLPRDEAHRGDWVEALVQHPRLIQRPIITLDDGSAVVARDEETLGRALSDAGPQGA